jgi:1-acyl-sn-glycerol-3-phosphate acyltransferase
MKWWRRWKKKSVLAGFSRRLPKVMNQQVKLPSQELVEHQDGLGAFRGAGLWWRFCHVVQANTFALGFSLRTEGGPHAPRSGPALVVANHQSFLDPVAVGLAFPRPLIYLARKSLFRNPIFSWLIRSLNAVPIDQEGIGKEGIRTILAQLNLGKAVLVFPEGERTLTGRMNPLKPGVHLLIKRTQAPIIPVGIAGAYQAWPRRQPLPIPAPLFWPTRPGTIAVSVGRPLEARRIAGLPREQALTELYDAIDAVQRRAEKLRRR